MDIWLQWNQNFLKEKIKINKNTQKKTDSNIERTKATKECIYYKNLTYGGTILKLEGHP